MQEEKRSDSMPSSDGTNLTLLAVLHGTGSSQDETPLNLLSEAARAVAACHRPTSTIDSYGKRYDSPLLVLPGPGGGAGEGSSFSERARESIAGLVCGLGKTGCEINALRVVTNLIQRLLKEPDSMTYQLGLIGHSRGAVAACYTASELAKLCEVLGEYTSLTHEGHLLFKVGFNDAIEGLFAGYARWSMRDLKLSKTDDKDSRGIHGGPRTFNESITERIEERSWEDWLSGRLAADPELLKKLRKVQCHIFAHDPVPGPSSTPGKRYAEVAGNVKQMHLLCQLHEEREAFNANHRASFSVQEPELTVFQATYLPGCHTAGIQCKTSEPKRYPFVAHRLTAHLMLEFLQGLGLPLEALTLHSYRKSNHVDVADERVHVVFSDQTETAGEAKDAAEAVDSRATQVDVPVHVGMGDEAKTADEAGDVSEPMDSSVVQFVATPVARETQAICSNEDLLAMYEQAMSIIRDRDDMTDAFDDRWLEGQETVVPVIRKRIHHTQFGLPFDQVPRLIHKLYPHWFDACFQGGLEASMQTMPTDTTIIKKEHDTFQTAYPELYASMQDRGVYPLDPSGPGFGSVWCIPWFLHFQDPMTYVQVNTLLLYERMQIVQQGIQRFFADHDALDVFLGAEWKTASRESEDVTYQHMKRMIDLMQAWQEKVVGEHFRDDLKEDNPFAVSQALLSEPCLSPLSFRTFLERYLLDLMLVGAKTLYVPIVGTGTVSGSPIKGVGAGRLRAHQPMALAERIDVLLDSVAQGRVQKERSAKSIQGLARRFMARRTLKRLQQRRRSAIHIQRVFRGVQARKFYASQRHSIIKLQALVRGWLSRRQHGVQSSMIPENQSNPRKRGMSAHESQHLKRLQVDQGQQGVKLHLALSSILTAEGAGSLMLWVFAQAHITLPFLASGLVHTLLWGVVATIMTVLGLTGQAYAVSQLPSQTPRSNDFPCKPSVRPPMPHPPRVSACRRAPRAGVD